MRRVFRRQAMGDGEDNKGRLSEAAEAVPLESVQA